MDRDEYKGNVRQCARCGQDHENIVYRRLTHPITDSDGKVWTHWAPCPTNGEPILMMFVDEQ